MATERLIPGEYPHPFVDALDRKTIDIIVYKSVHLTTPCLDSLADHIHDIASSHPRLIFNDSTGESNLHRMLESFASRHALVSKDKDKVYSYRE